MEESSAATRAANCALSLANQPEEGAERDTDIIDTKFWQLWTRHIQLLKKMARRWMNGHAADAEDALSTAAIKAASSYHRWHDQVVDERAWLCTLLRHVCLDWHRRSQNGAHVQRMLSTNSLTDVQVFERWRYSPECEYISKETVTRVTVLIDELPFALRAPLVARTLENRSYEEISREMHLSSANVRKRIQLARQHLRRNL
jgi:RNA polymerase sigma factor (sigma-70 family)